jgi:uncharacterized membrane protein YidH (DUF202 family)
LHIRTVTFGNHADSILIDSRWQRQDLRRLAAILARTHLREIPTTASAKLALLDDLAAQYRCPWLEFSEQVVGPAEVLRQLNPEQLKKAGWFPLSVKDNQASVIVHRPTTELAAKIRQALGVDTIRFTVTLPDDLVRIIEHNQDVNPGFPSTAGRTPLALVRTYLAVRRSLFAHYRTVMAKSRTGLAFVRTGFSFIAIAVLLFRIVGGGFLLFLEVPLLIAGLYLALTSIWNYLPARKVSTVLPSCGMTTPTGGTTVLTVENVNTDPSFVRSVLVAGAAKLRSGWSMLSPVMRRRFLASDRTDLAEERTELACYRTHMAKVRTGLAFVRTGNALIGFGYGLMRQFPSSSWRFFDICLLVIGGLMVGEGFFKYFRGRPAGIEGHATVRRGNAMKTIWDFFFPHLQRTPDADGHRLGLCLPGIEHGQLPGIWGTTGMALDRTLLAERRNVMARLRTTMARARTGFAFIRTGITIFVIGFVLAVYLPTGSTVWTVIEICMMLSGLLLIGDGFHWSIPAERTRKEYPYCYADMEIVIPDYGIPCRSWKKAVFGREFP